MKVFISWSGERSKRNAEAICEWLQTNIQAVEPWMSTDIEKGKRWQPEISKELEESRVGIICLNRDNMDSKWILFESGAIAKMGSSYTCTFLLDLLAKDVEPPLSFFQHTIFNKEDLRKLLSTINDLVKEEKGNFLQKDKLDKMFDMTWDDFQKKLSEISKSSKEETKQRSTESMLEEILNLNRNIDSKVDNNELLISDMITACELTMSTFRIPIPAVTGLPSGRAFFGTSGTSGSVGMGLREAKRKIASEKARDESEKL